MRRRRTFETAPAHLRELVPGPNAASPARRAWLAVVGFRTGRTGEGRGWLDRRTDESRPGSVPAGVVAYVPAVTGDLDEAFSGYDRAVPDRSVWGIEHPRVDPFPDDRRRDPRYEERLRQVHLSDSEGRTANGAGAGGAPGRLD